jgi:hypothetical protein
MACGVRVWGRWFFGQKVFDTKAVNSGANRIKKTRSISLNVLISRQNIVITTIGISEQHSRTGKGNTGTYRLEQS